MTPGLFTPFLAGPLRHVYQLLRSPAYRTWCLLGTRLGHLPRHMPCQATLGSACFRAPDAASLISTYGELFVNRLYDFPCPGGAPRILDLGANIGLSVLFFKQLYPSAHITAYEADPHIFSYLERNIRDNHLGDVELINRAVWHEDAMLDFIGDKADGGHVTPAGNSRSCQVEAVDVRRILGDESYDLVKIDIEGAEAEVIPAMSSHLDKVKCLFVEYHSIKGKMQALDRIVATLSAAGFRLHIQSVGARPSPFMPHADPGRFDMQLNLFGWRESC